MSSKKAPAKEKDASDIYQKLTPLEHIKKRSDTFIGSKKCTESVRWILEKTGLEFKIEQKNISYNPGLEQCTLEILTNALDHCYRCLADSKIIEQVTKISVNISSDSISVLNNGPGIPIEMHKEHKIYIPELIFGNLLTSSNYDDNVKRNWGGKNGYGAKLANVFSKKFIVELCCNGIHYQQEFTDGMTNKTQPIVTKSKVKDFTKITFYPDFKEFGMTSFDSNGTRKLIEKRVYDLAACTPKKVNVYLNEEKIDIRDFNDYVDIFLGSGKTKKIVYETDKWSVVFALNPNDNPTQISFVNGIFTEENGSHVNYIMDQVTKKVSEEIQNMSKVKKEKITIKPAYIKEHLIVFIKCLIDNPDFSTQTKTILTSKVSEFGSTCMIPNEIITKICKLGLVDQIINLALAKEMKTMIKSIKSEGRVARLSDVDKLDDATWAGTKKSNLCTLILTEGDSAKTTALTGLSVVGKDAWGVFPLKGKLLNVKTAAMSQLSGNEEIKNINKILGLNYDMKDKSKLRYHHVMLMCDSDVDGFHIKGLLINYFTNFWPEIVKEDFISCLLTPVVKITYSDKKVLDFYNLNDLEDFKKKNHSNEKSFKVKYYKGLGTSSKDEAREYFKKLKTNRLQYEYDPKRDNEKIFLAFHGDNADLRKEWISKSITKIANNEMHIDYTNQKVPVSSFIDTELVMFSIYDCTRSLPNMIDGLKVSQRKVLYGSILKKINNLNSEIKVATLGSFISEHTNYHHGEVSLHETITNMAQNFVGSNNLPLLFPSGAFGSRNKGGADSASPRYINTYLQKYTPLIFNEIDSKLLKYNIDDGTVIEPVNYVPIIPMILVNGSHGIGTGWSCTVPCFSPKDVIENIRILLKNKDSEVNEMTPWYKGFRGSISKVDTNKWISTGTFKRLSTKHVYLTELPIGVWYENFKSDLKKLETDNVLIFTDKVLEIGGEDYIEFDINFTNDITDKDLVKVLKLEKSLNATNMVGFNSKGLIQKYESPEEILWEFFQYRLELYSRRKKLLEDILNNDLIFRSERARFIRLVVDDKFILNKKKRVDLEKELANLKFKEISKDSTEKNFNYLLNMQLNMLTLEKIQELEKEVSDIQNELTTLKGKTDKDLWNEDLDKLCSVI
jgi:DNA topoisomerase-2